MFTLAGIVAIVSTLVAAAGSPALASAPADTREHLVSGVASALGEATCSEDWSRVDWCEPVWPAARVRELAALVVTVGRYESGLDPRIGATRCRLSRKECDAEVGPGGRLRAGSVGYFQLKRFHFTSAELREVLSGAGEWSVYLQARAAARTLAGAANACRGVSDFRAAFSGYATGGSTLAKRCFWRDAAKREATARWLLSLPSASAPVNREAARLEPPAVAARD